jgi:parallel beta-helix repeat protein
VRHERFLALFLVVLLVTAVFAVLRPPWEASAYTLRGIIYIEGDANFTAANGVTGGTGTPSDPYVIEGWEINASSGTGIEIRNTTAHFVVRDLYVHSGNETYEGIRFYNATNGRVENNSLSNNQYGIVLGFSSNVTVIGNNVSNHTIMGLVVASTDNATVADNNISLSGYDGVYVSFSDNISVKDNSFSSNGRDGIRSESVTNGIIAGNQVTQNGAFGISVRVVLTPTYNVTVSNNNVSGSYIGIEVDEASNSTVSGNVISGNVDDGIRIRDSTDITVLGNTVSSNGGEGMHVGWSQGVVVHHNSFVSNSLQAHDDRGSANSWDDGYPSGGNYWSNYTGVDDCSGPNQDICPAPDGLGDTPFVIDSDSQDNYPLMAPCASLENCRPPMPPVMLPARLTGSALENVTLSWLPSPDDGDGEDDIASYEVSYGDVYDPTGAGYGPLATLPGGTTSYVHTGAGVGDTSNFFYVVRAVEIGGNSTPAAQQAGKFARFLTAGMQLISVPLEQTNWSVDAILQTVPWDWARSYASLGGQEKRWTSNNQEKTWADLDTLDRTMALWVEVVADEWWTTAGLVPAKTEVAMEAGWNMMGYPSFIPRTVAEVLTGMAYESVEGYAPDPPYHLRNLSASDLMTAGGGYWIRAVSGAIIVIEN